LAFPTRINAASRPLPFPFTKRNSDCKRDCKGFGKTPFKARITAAAAYDFQVSALAVSVQKSCQPCQAVVAIRQIDGTVHGSFANVFE
jgi:hypothetical protein